MPGQAWGELRGLGFRSDTARSTPWLFEVADPVAGRGVVFANQLASAARGHTPRDDDFPRGWTVQNPCGVGSELPPLVCGLCGDVSDQPSHDCVALPLLSHGGV